MNQNLVREKRIAAQTLTARQSSNKVEWKPKDAGDYTIRMLPYIHDLDWPVTTVWKHFNISTSPFISLSTFGKADPIREYGDAIRANAAGSTDKNMYKVANMCDPTVRFYAPILVRGKEDEGVKFWDMSASDHEKILAIFDVAEYGDITDLANGRDLKVTHTKPVKEGTYAQNTILALPNTTPATTEQAVADLIVKMPTVQSILTEPTMDEMTLLLRKFTENGGKKVDLKAPTLTTPSNVVNAGPAIVQQPVNDIAVQQSTTVPAASAAPAGGDVNATFAQYFKK